MRNPSLTQGHVVLITAVPLGAGRFETRCAGQLIVASTREPLLDGSRALLAAGHDPDTIAVMRHAGSDVDALAARIGMAAQFYVEESPWAGPPLPQEGFAGCGRSAAHCASASGPCEGQSEAGGQSVTAHQDRGVQLACRYARTAGSRSHLSASPPRSARHGRRANHHDHSRTNRQKPDALAPGLRLLFPSLDDTPGQQAD
jgi:hypothetical protein